MLSLCCPSLPWEARQFICLHTSDAKHWWEKWGSILICILVYLYALLFLLVLLLPLAIFTFVISSSQLDSPQSLFILSLWFLSLLLLSNLSFLYFFLQICLQHHYVTKLFALRISCSSPALCCRGTDSHLAMSVAFQPESTYEWLSWETGRPKILVVSLSLTASSPTYCSYKKGCKGLHSCYVTSGLLIISFSPCPSVWEWNVSWHH